MLFKSCPVKVKAAGEKDGLDDNFSNGLAWPGGIGDPAEVAGCRCEMDLNF